MNALSTIPNKDQVEKLNFFGNKIREVDLARIFNEFPNLKYLNLDYNPLSAKNLEQLTSEQFSKLVEGMKSKSIRINSNKGTILTDLLEYSQKLIKSGDGSQTKNAYQLQAILQNNPIKNEQEPNNSTTPLLIGGGVLVIISALIIGYLWGQKSKEKELES